MLWQKYLVQAPEQSVARLELYFKRLVHEHYLPVAPGRLIVLHILTLPLRHSRLI